MDIDTHEAVLALLWLNLDATGMAGNVRLGALAAA